MTTPTTEPQATPSPQNPRRPAGPTPTSAEAVIAAVRKAYGLSADYQLSGAGTPEGEASVAWALWEHLEDPNLPRPHLPGDPPLRRNEPELSTQAGRATARALGQQVRAWRDQHGYTQRQLAELLGWDQPHVARLEGGGAYPTLATMGRLAERLAMQIVVRNTPEGLRVLLQPEPELAPPGATAA